MLLRLSSPEIKRLLVSLRPGLHVRRKCKRKEKTRVNRGKTSANVRYGDFVRLPCTSSRAFFPARKRKQAKRDLIAILENDFN